MEHTPGELESSPGVPGSLVVLALLATLVGDSGDFVWWRFILKDVSLGVVTGLVVGYAASLLMPRKMTLGYETALSAMKPMAPLNWSQTVSRRPSGSFIRRIGSESLGDARVPTNHLWGGWLRARV